MEQYILVIDYMKTIQQNYGTHIIKAVLTPLQHRGNMVLRGMRGSLETLPTSRQYGTERYKEASHSTERRIQASHIFPFLLKLNTNVIQ